MQKWKDKAARLPYFLLLTGSAFHIAKVPQMDLCFKQTVKLPTSKGSV